MPGPWRSRAPGWTRRRRAHSATASWRPGVVVAAVEATLSLAALLARFGAANLDERIAIAERGTEPKIENTVAEAAGRVVLAALMISSRRDQPTVAGITA